MLGAEPRFWPALVVLGAALAALLLPPLLPPLAVAGNFAEDFALARLAPPEPQHRGIVILAVTEDTLAAFPYRAPLDRAFLTSLIERLRRAGVRSIGLDVLIDQPTEPDKDQALRDALAAPGAPVVLLTAAEGTALTERQRRFHQDFLRGSHAGHGNLARDRIDGTVRRHVPLLSGNGRPMPSLPAALAAQAGLTVPAEPFTIAWRGRPADPATSPFPIYPAQAAALLPDAWLNGRVVLIGAQVPDLDRHRTPLSLGGQSTAGVEIQAHVLAQLLDGRQSPRLGWAAQAAAATALAVAGTLIAMAGLTPLAEIALGILVLTLLWAGTAALFAMGGPLLPPLGASLAWILALGATSAWLTFDEKRQRATLMRLFKSHLSEPVAEAMWRHRDLILSGGKPKPQRMVATVMFSDIEGFTPISERLGPDRLMAWIEDYIEAMTRIVIAHDGIVLRFLGDGILAAFGAPVARDSEEAIDRDAVRAVTCALAMERELQRLDEQWRRQDLPEVRIRVGIVTGPMVGGSLGAARHLEYSLMGDAVNTAARLEALAKTVASAPGHPCRILVARATWERLGGRFEGRWLGDQAVKGKEEAVGVFLILGPGMGVAADFPPPRPLPPDAPAAPVR